ncbi:MAG: alpha/beta fold hydrolase [Patescibacteria group bacterium]
MSERIILKTSDGVEIIGDYYAVESASATALVLLHMMPADKNSYAAFAKKAKKAGFQSLAIDLRGHGESVNSVKGKLDYKNFSDEEHQKTVLDVEAAVDFFKGKGIAPEKIYFVGASIGANLALWQLAERPEFKKAVLLSPGLNYRGIETEPTAEKLKENQAVFFVSAEGDAYSADSARKLFDIAKSKKEIKIYGGSEHGTNLFKTNPELMEEIIRFLEEK